MLQLSGHSAAGVGAVRSALPILWDLCVCAHEKATAGWQTGLLGPY